MTLLHTRVRPPTQTQNSDSINRETRSQHTTASILAIVAGVVLAAASASTNAIYGWQRSDMLASQMTWAAVSVAASVILALAPTALFKAIQARSLAGSVIAILALTLCGAYSFAAAIGASAGQRIASQASQTGDDGTRARLQRSYDAARTDLDSLPLSPRTAAEIEAKITGLKQTPGANDCAKIDGPVSKKVCPEVATLEAERARAAKGEQLQATMADASRDLAKLGKPKVANTDAAAISAYLAVAGVTVSVDALNRWLALLTVALIEIGGGLSFAVSSVLKGAGTGVQSAPIETVPSEHAKLGVSTGVQIIVADNEKEANEIRALHGVQDVSNLGVQKLDVPDAYSGRLLLMLKDLGGEVYSGHRALGRALGCSPAHVGNVLRDLSEAGRVTVKATKTGTVVRLAA